MIRSFDLFETQLAFTMLVILDIFHTDFLTICGGIPRQAEDKALSTSTEVNRGR